MRCLYRIGLIVGRFQILHRGHEEMVRKALDLCDKVVVYISSSQEAGTEKNPFSYSVRAQIRANAKLQTLGRIKEKTCEKVISYC